MYLDEYLSLETDFAEAYKKCASETMTSAERMFALWQAVEHINAKKIPGAFVECGVWRGGSTMMAAHSFLHHNDKDRELWLYDTFEGMPDAADVDRMAATGQAAQEVLLSEEKNEDSVFWAIADKATVSTNMAKTGYPSKRIHYVEGMVEETLPAQVPDQIALLRLDTDWYSSTMHELVHLWPRLVPGGVIIIDDYGFWEGARRAVEDYFSERTDRPFLARIDITGRMAVKA